MADLNDSAKPRYLDWVLPGATRDSWLVPSALLSSRWSQDNPLTPDPARLYTGEISARVGLDELQRVLEKFGAERPGVEVTGGSLGVLTWNVTYRQGNDAFLLTLPRAIDSEGTHNRRRAKVPAAAFDNARSYIARGLGRYLLAPCELLALEGGLVGAVFSVPASHHPLSFSQGRARIDRQDAEGDWVVPLGHAPSVALLTELITALVYHYDPDDGGGTALSDVLVNDGDFLARRDASGNLELRLTVARFRQAGIPPNRFLLHLMQLIAYEDWTIGDKLRGLPALISHPSLVLAGVDQGLEQRYADLGLEPALAHRASRRWICEFARSPEGRGYRPWVERYLAGALPPTLDQDPRTGWWNLTELRQRRNFAQLTQRYHPNESNAAEAEQLAAAVERLTRHLRSPRPREEAGQLFVNDLGLVEVKNLLSLAPHAAPELANEWFQRWPYRRSEDLPRDLAETLPPDVRASLDYRRPLPAEEDGNLQCLDSALQDPLAVPLANPEVFDPLVFPLALQGAAVDRFPSFEGYMDDALHHPDFGYYKRRVSIGRTGHFSTHPEDLSPDYGKWMADWIGALYAEMLDRGDTKPSETLPIVEFGAGTGRLARDILDAITARAASSPPGSLWRQLRTKLRYHVFELSDSLRNEQRKLLGPDAEVAAGDARSPGVCLRQDFPGGINGILLSNELPDAFGVHKLILSAQGDAHAVVVVPRLEPNALEQLSPKLSARVTAVDIELRRTFGWTRHAADRFLDHETFRSVMSRSFELDAEARDLLLDRLWFEEGLVEAQAFPQLAASLCRDSKELAQALAEGESGVVVYVNLHAERFIQELAENLRTGFVLTVDYGDSTREMLAAARQRMFPFRVYRHEGQFIPRPNDPYSRPGTQDLTADVNFTSLARAGLDSGLSLVHYGLERDIAHNDMKRLLSAERGSALEQFLGNPAFKLLALGTRSSEVFARHFTPLALLAEEPVHAAAGSARVASIQVRLQGG